MIEELRKKFLKETLDIEESLEDVTIDLSNKIWKVFLHLEFEITTLNQGVFFNFYDDLIIEINKTKYNGKFSCDEKNITKLYLEIFHSIFLQYGFLLEQLFKKKLDVIFDNEKDLILLEEYFLYQSKKAMMNYLECLKHPYIYLNNEVKIIDGDFIQDNLYNIIIYKDVFVWFEKGVFVMKYNKKSRGYYKNTILDTLSYIFGKPFFYRTENTEFNKKLFEIHSMMNLCDMLSLRQKNFFKNNNKSTQLEKYIIQSPVFETTPLTSIEAEYTKIAYPYNIIHLRQIEGHELLNLYQSSLKQIEPVSRCIFLYRIFEFGVDIHYKKKINPKEYKVETALEYYIKKIDSFEYTPIYFDAYNYNNSSKKTYEKNNRNFITALKKEKKKIFEEWKTHKFLKNKKPSKIIYEQGRNKVVHSTNGKKGKYNARYDYSESYKHINNVNIILELIARYLIEIMNPGISKVVKKKTEEK